MPTDAPLADAGVWSVWALEDGRERTIFFRAPGRRPQLSLTFDAGFDEAEVVHDADALASPGHFDPGTYPFSEYLACRLLGRSGLVELHASAVLDGDEVLVFVGHSGAGKTTMAGIAQAAGARILSDDRTIIGVREGSLFAWGTPWHGLGRHSLAEGGRIRAMYLLVQDSKNAIVRFDGAAAVRELLTRAIQPRVRPDETLATVESIGRIVSSNGLAALHFQPVEAAYRLARDSD